MLYPLFATTRYATRQPCARAKVKIFGGILVTLIILSTTIARSAEPPGEYQGVLDGAEYVIVVRPYGMVVWSCSRMGIRLKAPGAASHFQSRSAIT